MVIVAAPARDRAVEVKPAVVAAASGDGPNASGGGSRSWLLSVPQHVAVWLGSSAHAPPSNMPAFQDVATLPNVPPGHAS